MSLADASKRAQRAALRVKYEGPGARRVTVGTVVCIAVMGPVSRRENLEPGGFEIENEVRATVRQSELVTRPAIGVQVTEVDGSTKYRLRHVTDDAMSGEWVLALAEEDVG